MTLRWLLSRTAIIPAVLRTRGSIFMALGRHDEALADFRQVVTKGRPHPEP
jgi:hypothetical protein